MIEAGARAGGGRGLGVELGVAVEECADDDDAGVGVVVDGVDHDGLAFAGDVERALQRVDRFGGDGGAAVFVDDRYGRADGRVANLVDDKGLEVVLGERAGQDAAFVVPGGVAALPLGGRILTLVAAAT